MRKLIFLFILLPVLLFGQGYGHLSNVLVTADTTDVSKDVGIFMIDTSGDTLLYMGMVNYWKAIYGKNDDAIFDELLVRDDATFEARVYITSTANDSLIITGEDPTLQFIDNDDASVDKISITGVDSLLQIDGTTLVIDTHNDEVAIGTTNPTALLTVSGPAGAPGAIDLSTEELTVVNGDVLGKIEFDAPLESDGTDAILVGAAIEAIAEGTFAADNNATELVFKTAASEAATQKMVITSTGNIGVMTTAPDGVLEINMGTNKQVRLSYNDVDGSAIDYSKFEVGDDGALTITTIDDGAAEGDILLFPDGLVGIATTVPAKALEINHATGANLRLTYNDADGSASYYADLETTSSGDLTVTPSGGDMYLVGNLGVGEATPVTLTEWSSTAPYLTIHNTTEEDGDYGREGKLIFRGEQTGTEETVLGEIEFAHDGTSDDEKGIFTIRVNDGDDGSSPSDVVTVDAVGAVGLVGSLTLDDGDGDSPFLYLKCQGDKILSLQKLDAGNAELVNDEGDIVFRATGADVISEESFTIGDGTAIDYVLKFDASNADGTVTWDEDPGEFDISADINVTGDVSGTTIGGITEANLVDKTAAEEISGIWEIQDDTKLNFGNDADFSIEYDEDNANNMRFSGADIRVVGANIILPITLTGSDSGVIYKGADRFIHDFKATGADGYNTFIGIGSGNFTMAIDGSAVHASSNTGIGYNTLQALTTGYQNTASGLDALYSNTTGVNNTASGKDALYSNTTGVNNTASGLDALRYNTTGYSNTASGMNALYSNTTGVNNTASGKDALYYNTTGVNNTASGRNVLYYNTTGYYNTASGKDALYSNTTGYYNTASGMNALYFNEANNNTAFGYVAFNTFNEDAGDTETFAFGDIDAAGDTITIVSHDWTGYVNLKYTEGTSAITGLTDGDIDLWKVADADNLVGLTTAITDAGSGTGHTFTHQHVYTNATALGYNAEPDASNQVMLGDVNVTEVKTAGSGTFGGDLTITGDDLFMNTNTDGMMLMADGTNFNPVQVSGDVEISNSGATTIQSDAVEEGMLKAVDSATDEDFLTYEATTGDFEWHTLAEMGGQPLHASLTSIAGLSETNGGMLYGTADNAYAWLAAGTSNYLLQGNGAGAPSWTNAPTVAGTNITGIPLDGDFGSNGLMERTGAGTYDIATATDIAGHLTWSTNITNTTGTITVDDFAVKNNTTDAMSASTDGFSLFVITNTDETLAAETYILALQHNEEFDATANGDFIKCVEDANGTPGTLFRIEYDGDVISAGNIVGATYGSDGSISDAELLTLDNGTTSQILVGGGAGSAPVWGADIPTAVTIGTAYVYRTGGTDVPDADVADNISITNISQVGDISATASEINTPLDGATTTLAEFQQLQTIGATTISANQWATLGGIAETLAAAELNLLDGETDLANQAELNAVAALVDTDDEIIAIINASPSTQIGVPAGGTGVGTLNDGGLLVGAGTGAVEVLADGLTTQILVGGGADTNPVWTTATGTNAPVRATSPTLVTPVLGAATATSIVASSNYLVEGYATGRNVMRSIRLTITPGGTPGTDISVDDISSTVYTFNAPSITDVTNLEKNETDGQWTLSADGTTITLNLTEAVIGILNASFAIQDLNSSTAPTYFPSVIITGSNLVMSFSLEGTSAAVDLTGILDAGDTCDLLISFVTSS